MCYMLCYSYFHLFFLQSRKQKAFFFPHHREYLVCMCIMCSLPHQVFLCNFNREAKETLITTFVSLLLLIASQCLQLWDTKWTRRKVSSRVHIHCVDSTPTPTSSPRAAPPSVSGRGRRSSEQ